MKSAYELAMERLEKKAPSLALTDEQKQQMAEIDSTFKARIAEKELFLKDQIGKALAAGKPRRSRVAAKAAQHRYPAFAGRCGDEEGKAPRVFFEVARPPRWLERLPGRSVQTIRETGSPGRSWEIGGSEDCLLPGMVPRLPGPALSAFLRGEKNEDFSLKTTNFSCFYGANRLERGASVKIISRRHKNCY